MAVQQTPRDALGDRVCSPRTLIDLVCDLVGEPEALLRDRLGHRRALRDLVDEEPELLALEQPRHQQVDQPAVDELADGALRRRVLDDPRRQPLHGPKIDYVWGGSVGFSYDRIPHAGEANGIYYSMGYCGHGVQMATYMGRVMAEVMDGHPEANPWRQIEFPKVPVPGYRGTAWFLPFAGAYYRLKDRLR